MQVWGERQYQEPERLADFHFGPAPVVKCAWIRRRWRQDLHVKDDEHMLVFLFETLAMKRAKGRNMCSASASSGDESQAMHRLIPYLFQCLDFCFRSGVRLDAEHLKGSLLRHKTSRTQQSEYFPSKQITLMAEVPCIIYREIVTDVPRTQQPTPHSCRGRCAIPCLCTPPIHLAWLDDLHRPERYFQLA